MKLNRLDRFFWRVSALLTLVIGATVLGLILNGDRQDSVERYGEQRSEQYDNTQPTSSFTPVVTTKDKLQKVTSPKLQLFTLDYWRADADITFDNGVVCSRATALMAEYVGAEIKSAWEHIPGVAQLRFNIDRLVLCNELMQNGKAMSLLSVRAPKAEKDDVYFTIPTRVAKTPKAIQGVFFSQLFLLAEQEFGELWAAKWDEKFGQPTASTAFQGVEYHNSRTERAAWFKYFMQDKDAMYRQVMLSKNTVLIEKLGTMQGILSQDWQKNIEFTPIPEPKKSEAVASTQPVVTSQPSTPVSQARRQFDQYIAQTYQQGTSSVKDMSAKDAEKAFGIKGLQFAPNNFAPDLPFKLGFAHIDVDIRGYKCKSTTPMNVSMSGRYLDKAWKKISVTAQQQLGLKFVFFCSELLSPQGWQMGGMATTYHDTVFVRIPKYNAQNGKFVKKTFFHELFHYSEFRSRRFFNHSWDNVFSGYLGSYREDLNDSRIGSGKRGFLNAYSMTFSAEERAELFSELMLNPEKVEEYVKQKNDSVLSMKVARMKQIMQINWGVKRQ